MSVNTKPCERCGDEFKRNPKYSEKQWASARFCGRSCGTWNKGLTKHDDPRMMAIAEQVKVSAKGRPAWNKGLTKETDERMALIAEKVSEAQIGKDINDAQRRALKEGRKWAKGRTAEDTPAIARSAKKRSRILKGRENPEHAKRMREFFAENPHKHPNAILARKTKGHGYTHIEEIVSELLGEMGVDAAFNKRIGSKWVDFAVVSQRAVIECDGEYWHQDEEAERERDEYIRARGWSILHLTGSDIVNRTAWCRDQVAGFLEMEAVA